MLCLQLSLALGVLKQCACSSGHSAADYPLVSSALLLSCFMTEHHAAFDAAVHQTGRPEALLTCLQGHVVATSPAYSHRLPHVFSRPDEFDPERFAAPREEDKAAPFSFIGFGGGRHGCMGSNFAILQVQQPPLSCLM